MTIATTPTILKEKDFEHFTVSFRSDGIMQFIFKAEQTINIDDLKEMVKTNGEFGGKKKYPCLVIGAKNSLITEEAKYFSATPEANIYIKSCAIVVSNVAQRLLANTYLQFSKPISPTKVFDQEAKAVEWLLSK